MILDMLSKIIVVKGDQQFLQLFSLPRQYNMTYNTFLEKALNDCGQVIRTLEYKFDYTCKVFSMKIDEETLKRLDIVAMNLRTSRADLVRRLFLAKAKGLC